MVWMMQAASSLSTLPEEKERVGDFCLVSLINLDANLLSKEVLSVIPNMFCAS